MPRAQALVAGTLTLDQAFFTAAFGTKPTITMLGFASYAGLGQATTIPITTFDANVQIGNAESFTGPNAISQFGRPMPMDCASYTCPLCTRRHQAASIQPLDIATLKDTLHHAADTWGKAAYLDALAHGLSRADALVSFSESLEHRRPIWNRLPCYPERSGFNPAPAVKVAGRSPG